MNNSRKIAYASIAASLITGALIICKSYPVSTMTSAWLNLGAGILAICAITCAASEYFSPPQSGQLIRAPDKFIRVTAGCVGIASGVLWVISALYGIFQPINNA